MKDMDKLRMGVSPGEIAETIEILKTRKKKK
jgi:hypothetical protein